MADKVLTITQPSSIDVTSCRVTRAAGVTKMAFSYDPPGAGPTNTQYAEVLDSELTAPERTNLNASLLAAYNIAKAKMGF